MDRNFHEKICEAMKQAQLEAAELILHAEKILGESKSCSRDVVTEYDRRVQSFLEGKMREILPDCRFFCEEMDHRDDLTAEQVFVIDPIDGTMNFVRGFKHSCISMAYLERGIVCAAAIYNPYTEEMFSAVKGGGAFLNGRPIQVEDRALSDSLVCFGSAPYYPELYEKSFALAKAAFENSLDLRREAAAALDLCSVASGRAGVFFELCLSYWDYAAGALIVEEAGGVCRDISGAELSRNGEKGSIAAGSPRALKEFLELAGKLQ